MVGTSPQVRRVIRDSSWLGIGGTGRLILIALAQVALGLLIPVGAVIVELTGECLGHDVVITCGILVDVG